MFNENLYESRIKKKHLLMLFFFIYAIHVKYNFVHTFMTCVVSDEKIFAKICHWLNAS